ncbi:MAG: fructosamine kinase family protein [Priestia megaterium]|uniref:fructosamine kinase family protein n=1 Tax=Priestia megaterium TaxID=1404 RepID=UPI000A6A5774|nr:fructosamine kinase family protein [Priestia megaterium]
MTFPKQGCTSDVGNLHTAKGRYVLKRAKGEKYRKWLFKEYYVLKNIKKLEKFRSPNAYKFVQTAEQSWLLLEFFEGQTVREYLEKEDNEKKRARLFLRDMARGFHRANFVILQKVCTSFFKE